MSTLNGGLSLQFTNYDLTIALKNLNIKLKLDLRRAFSGWKLTNARLAGKYLCTAVNLDSLDLGLRYLSLTEELSQSSFTTRKRKRDCL